MKQVILNSVGEKLKNGKLKNKWENMNKFIRNPFLKLFSFLQIKITKAIWSLDNALVFNSS